MKGDRTEVQKSSLNTLSVSGPTLAVRAVILIWGFIFLAALAAVTDLNLELKKRNHTLHKKEEKHEAIHVSRPEEELPVQIGDFNSVQIGDINVALRT